MPDFRSYILAARNEEFCAQNARAIENDSRKDELEADLEILNMLHDRCVAASLGEELPKESNFIYLNKDLKINDIGLIDILSNPIFTVQEGAQIILRADLHDFEIPNLVDQLVENIPTLTEYFEEQGLEVKPFEEFGIEQGFFLRIGDRNLTILLGYRSNIAEDLEDILPLIEIPKLKSSIIIRQKGLHFDENDNTKCEGDVKNFLGDLRVVLAGFYNVLNIPLPNFMQE